MSPRLVAMDAVLLQRLLDEERDPVVRDYCTPENFISRVLIDGLSFALLEGEMLVAGAGVVPLWPGRAEAWQLTSRHARPRQLVAGARIAAAFMDRLQADPAFRRIEIYVRDGARWCGSFVAALGFAREGLLRHWDPAGRDTWICSRVRGAA